MYKLNSFLFLILFLSGCSSNPIEKNNSNDQSDPFECIVTPEDAVPFGKAMIDIENYEKYLKENNLDSNFVRAFTKSSIDFIEGLGLAIDENAKVQFKHVRFYLGLNDSMEFKLYLTPVVGANLRKEKGSIRAGKDHILCRSITAVTDKQVSQEGYMLDFSMPCPKTCPE